MNKKVILSRSRNMTNWRIKENKSKDFLNNLRSKSIINKLKRADKSLKEKHYIEMAKLLKVLDYI